MNLLVNVASNPILRPKVRQIPWQAIRERKRARKEAEKRQLEGIESQEIFKLCIEGKLKRAMDARQPPLADRTFFENFMRCGVENFYIMCALCGDGHEVSYQCSQKWCPRCNWRIAMRRRMLLEKMTKQIYSVKHVVLTQRNFHQLTRDKIMESRKNLFRLRKRKVFGKVSGGCASLEFTNEGRGWHMHWHLLLQSHFISAQELAISWGELVGQEYAIVKVMDVSEKSYLQEICKYVVDGSTLSSWKPKQILELILALRRTQNFTTFGKFRELRRFAQAVIDCDKPAADPCSCGSNEYVFGHDRQHCGRIAAKKGY